MIRRMKQYKRAYEKRFYLTSVNKYTTLEFNEEDDQRSTVSYGTYTQRKTSSYSGKNDGQGRSEPGRGRKTNRCFENQYKQNHASEVSCQHGFFIKNGGKPWSQSRIESEKVEDLIEAFDKNIFFVVKV